MAGNSPHGGGFPGAGDDFDPMTLPPRTRPFIPGRYRPPAHVLPRVVFRHFTSFDERAPVDLLLREPEQHLSHEARELWVYVYFPSLAPELEVVGIPVTPYSLIFEGPHQPRPRETLLRLR
ncbi:uncharacterized protein LOC114316763 [Camellia sinensis]|uniref:uncharacterized protein LOC114316763 n=1 Tax=Camellia sinensis TaxID=4442 RepID=UPI0010368C3A|nr:uncharacterized protein LOC114316763 [Camellia sinensis]